MKGSIRSGLVPARGYPAADRGLLVVWGQLASAPFGGMTWQVLHHLAGFRMLGYDVWYVEEADFLLHPDDMGYPSEVGANVAFLAQQMAAVGLSDRWLFRAEPLDPDWYGAGDGETARRLHRDADAVFNLCGTRWAGHTDDLARNLVYLETDPGHVQISLAQGSPPLRRQLEHHRRLYTYGLNVGSPAFPVPVEPFEWLPTTPPVVMDWWDGAGPPTRQAFTTISQWKVIEKPPLTWDGFAFEWRKDLLFEAVLDLPGRTIGELELALRHVGDDRDRIEAQGWSVLDAARLDDPRAYRDYIRASAGEFTISKDQYTRLRTGWFSDRSACYLAAGRPVVTQSTGFEAHLPTGEGLFAFHDIDSAAAALDAITLDYDRHARAAREIAREYFAHDRVLPALLTEASSCA